jgi:hypothetical protein
MKNVHLDGTEITIGLEFGDYIEEDGEPLELVFTEEDLTNFKNGVNFIYDEYLKFKGK